MRIARIKTAQKATDPDLVDLELMDPLMKGLFHTLALEESRHKLRFELEYDEYILREN
jgi:hypothetical protein